MAYGMQLKDSVGNITYDSTSQGGVFVEYLTLPVLGDTIIRNVPYTDLIGRNIYVIPIQTGDHQYKLFGPTDVTPPYISPVGYPIIRYKQNDTTGIAGFFWVKPTILMVFAL